jgi:hypothetical protein
MEIKNLIVSKKFVKTEILILLFLDFLCFVTIYFEDFLFRSRYYEKIVGIIFWIYFPLIVILSLTIFYQIILAYIRLNNNILKIQILVTELLFFTAVASEIIISTKIRL